MQVLGCFRSSEVTIALHPAVVANVRDALTTTTRARAAAFFSPRTHARLVAADGRLVAFAGWAGSRRHRRRRRAACLKTLSRACRLLRSHTHARASLSGRRTISGARRARAPRRSHARRRPRAGAS